MLTSRQRLLVKLNQLEKKWVHHQRSVNKYKFDLVGKIYQYQAGMTYLMLPAFLFGWTLGRFIRFRFAGFIKLFRQLSRFLLLTAFAQAKNKLLVRLKQR